MYNNAMGEYLWVLQMPNVFLSIKTQSKSRGSLFFLCADGLDDVELAYILFSRWGFCGPVRRLSSYSQCQCALGPRRPFGVSLCCVRDSLMKV